MVNVISVSGGKDSTAIALLAMERGVENCRFVFCDTGNECSETYDYIEYLKTFFPIETLKADFAKKIAIRRKKLLETGQEARAKATVASGNPFYDLAMLKGRFPSAMARFCTTELKVNVIKQFIADILSTGEDVDNWSGVRAEESPKRAKLTEREFFFADSQSGAESWHFRPILKWPSQDCFSIMKRHGVKPNPLYLKGFSRVGCFPCINCRKSELREIATQFPEEIDRIREWEASIAPALKRGQSSFFPITQGRVTIDDWVDWSMTSRGGKQLPLALEDTTTCRSVYGLCE